MYWYSDFRPQWIPSIRGIKKRQRKRKRKKGRRAVGDRSEKRLRPWVGALKDLHGIHGPLKLFLKVEFGQDSCLVSPPCITTDDILLFFKVYDPANEKIRYVHQSIDFYEVYSSVYVLGDSKWRIFLRRMGQGDNDVSLYIKVVNAASLPFGWSIYVEYKLTIINQFTTTLNFQKVSCHHINAKDNHHGFSCFMPFEVFCGAYFGYTIGDACSIEVEIISYGVTKRWPNSQKKEIEFVGLKNQGATCYLNSLLQTLYYISYFRKVVYQMPTNHNDEPKENIPLALQRLFYNLQHSESSVATNELTRSFGWDQCDAFVQHDVQEMSRLLCEALEESMTEEWGYY
ncbi:ubiquitin C-terminal hydrolase 13-like isoform X2 [Andrographis paniculata]|uniref:ubiquitin C-terminal hydrolase 13-like isoform X2 n=1 Tax=Andrographis paniculata TaxID=175694 RepID=UPI0021E78523|nr:ubiquitin C-terminal hydrolase 13-like isoform X2 [Andrographis paniculata]XP_051113567.1 ubiquitin C-terminal hydrolase 13-like isoform X2 [Andrographis paniculata]